MRKRSSKKGKPHKQIGNGLMDFIEVICGKGREKGILLAAGGINQQQIFDMAQQPPAENG